MTDIFVNLKRFDVPRQVGGLCPVSDPQDWITSVIQASVALGLGDLPGTQLVFLLPEGLVYAAGLALAKHPQQNDSISIGCQGVHWKDVEAGGNFGAFTTSLPAKAARALGCSWSIIGHSEERRAKLQVIEAYDGAVQQDPGRFASAQQAVSSLVRDEVQNAFHAGLNVLLCVGESASERGEGDFAEQKPRIQAVLERQLLSSLPRDREVLTRGRLVIGYEPVWAIGPGKTPPDAGYIAFVSGFIQKVIADHFALDPVVIYGGGLKEENAASIAEISTVGGGLVALTRFSGEIGFYVDDLGKIIANFLREKRS